MYIHRVNISFFIVETNNKRRQRIFKGCLDGHMHLFFTFFKCHYFSASNSQIYNFRNTFHTISGISQLIVAIGHIFIIISYFSTNKKNITNINYIFVNNLFFVLTNV